MKSRISLKLSMMVNYVLTAALPVLVVGLVALESITRSMVTEFTAINHTLTVSLAGEVDRFLDEPQDLIKHVAATLNDGTLIEVGDINRFLVSLTSHYPYLDMIKVLDDAGVVRHLAPYDENIFLMNVSGQDYYRNARDQKDAVWWSDTFISPQTGRPTIVLCTSLKKGMVVGHLDLSFLSSVIEKVEIGFPGNAFITDNIGTAIAHVDRSFVSQRMNLRNLEPVRKGLLGSEGTFRYRDNGEEQLGSVAIIAKTRWLVTIIQPVEEAFASVYRARRIIWGGTAGAIFLALMIALVNTRKTLRPLFRLADDTRRIAQGDYRYHLRSAGYREIYEVENNFKSMAGAVRKREEALREAQNYIRSIINSMPSVLIGVDRNGVVTQWNRMAEVVSGIGAEEAAGKNISEVFPPLGGKMEKVMRALAEKRLHKDEKVPGTRDGEACFSDITVYPLAGSGEEGAVIRIDDVTETVKFGEMMIQTEKMMSVGGLAAGMAHEINNPLAGILQNTQVLKNRLSPGVARNERAARECGVSMEAVSGYLTSRGVYPMVDMIRDAGQRATDIVKNMLSFVRKGEYAVAEHDLAELLDRSVTIAETDYDLRMTYDFKQIGIVREYEADIPSVMCEGSKLQQVFLNILRNGAEAMADHGTAAPAFVFRLAREDRFVRIEIEDNGPGMDEAVRRRIFEPFYTTKPVGRGTGLGLSVSYFIIREDHGGEMAVESEKGKGTRFIIRLPLRREFK